MNFGVNLAVFVTSFLTLMSVIGACSSNPHKARKIKTEMKKEQTVSGDENLGIKGGNLVVQRKVMMNEELRRLQNEVYSLEDRVYGNRKFRSKGLYGALKDCRIKQTSKELGGDGKLMWTEPIDRVTDKEDVFEIGIDEQDKIVAVSEEFLKDRIARFQGYKRVLQKREDEYEEKLAICDAAVRAKEFEIKQKSASSAATAGE